MLRRPPPGECNAKNDHDHIALRASWTKNHPITHRRCGRCPVRPRTRQSRISHHRVQKRPDGPKRLSGGVNGGLANPAYHVGMLGNVAIVPSAAATRWADKPPKRGRTTKARQPVGLCSSTIRCDRGPHEIPNSSHTSRFQMAERQNWSKTSLTAQALGHTDPLTKALVPPYSHLHDLYPRSRQRLLLRFRLWAPGQWNGARYRGRHRHARGRRGRRRAVLLGNVGGHRLLPRPRPRRSHRRVERHVLGIAELAAH